MGELKDYIERTLRCFEDMCGDFVQISGLKYEFDSRKEGGERLVKLMQLDGKEVEDNEKFSVAMSDFMWANSKFVKNELYNMVTVNDNVPMLMGLYDAVEKAGDRCVANEKDGRIKNLAESQ